ncbi:hypothetical protein DFR69_103356 [Nocardia neocaledoniensis]|uniref:Uncharacterized protein n=1 Tax=Nocardia neocaledoniensis TaxID=236511 RepID=A0A317NS10_9NOCA|nr:hypothetical protein DFR69_103356 [Nocardia neocaledoniensis]
MSYANTSDCSRPNPTPLSILTISARSAMTSPARTPRPASRTRPIPGSSTTIISTTLKALPTRRMSKTFYAKEIRSSPARTRAPTPMARPSTTVGVDNPVAETTASTAHYRPCPRSSAYPGSPLLVGPTTTRTALPTPEAVSRTATSARLPGSAATGWAIPGCQSMRSIRLCMTTSRTWDLAQQLWSPPAGTRETPTASAVTTRTEPLSSKKATPPSSSSHPEHRDRCGGILNLVKHLTRPQHR